MSLSLSDRAERIVQAEIRAMTIECEKVGGINLAQGVCDTEVPLCVRRGAQTAMDDGINSYTRYDGLSQLREAIARKMKAYNGIDADPETQITVSAGSTGALYCASLALLNRGDEVILFEPYYGYHLNNFMAAEVVPTYVTTHPPEWTFDPDDLEKAVSPRTKGILVCTPSNPSGKVFTREELAIIAEFAERHDIFVFTDEIYEYFLYNGRQHVSPGSLPGTEERTITISGFSKTFSITGWRIGYCVSHPKWAQMIGYMNDLIYVCAPAPLQHGVAVGIDEIDQEYRQGLSQEYTEKRGQICGALEEGGLTPYVPQGSYYVLADASGLAGDTSKEKAMRLLEVTGVACVPGEAFYHGLDGENLLRFCYAKPDADLDEACERLGRLKGE